jgi:hypothetical protein
MSHFWIHRRWCFGHFLLHLHIFLTRFIIFITKCSRHFYMYISLNSLDIIFNGSFKAKRELRPAFGVFCIVLFTDFQEGLGKKLQSFFTKADCTLAPVLFEKHHQTTVRGFREIYTNSKLCPKFTWTLNHPFYHEMIYTIIWTAV